MQTSDYNLNDTIFAPITSKFGGSVCVLRISGRNAFDFLKSTDKQKLKPNYASFAKIFTDDQLLDEAIITQFSEPNSFTGENILEISIHGSEYIYNKIVTIFTEKYGFRFASNGEFLYRALINNKLDLTKAESIDLLIKSTTKNQHKLAIRGLTGNIADVYKQWHEDLKNILSLLEANIDFSDQEIPQDIIDEIDESIIKISNSMVKILDSNDLIHKVIDGFKIVILGRPNAGKSTLINILTKSNIAIVSDIPGTTRDLISAKLDIGGNLVNIVDTAGIRTEVENIIEQEGVNRAKDAIKSADLRLFLFEKGKLDNNLIDEFFEKDDILIASKSDLITSEIDNRMLTFSKNSGIEFNILIEEIAKKIEEKSCHINDLMCISERQRLLVNKTYKIIRDINVDNEIEIIAEDIRFAIATLDSIFGNTNIEDILGNIFSKFCIGK